MCTILNVVERHSKMDNTSEGNANLRNKKGATKHCSWGLCNMDSRYPERMKGVFFIRFAKPGRLKDTMSDWERQQNLKKTEKAKRWFHACGRKDFNRIEQIKKDTYIYSLHFVGQGPTEEHPDPVKSGDERFFERRKRKPQKQRPLHKKNKKDKFDIASYSGNASSSNENTLLTTDTTDVTDNSIISNTEILFEKRDRQFKQERDF